MAEEDAQVGDELAVTAQQLQDNDYLGNNDVHEQKCSQPVPMPRKSDTSLIMGEFRTGSYEGNLLLANNGHNKHRLKHVQNSDSEEGFLSTSPDSANGEVMPKACSNGSKLAHNNTSNTGNKSSATKCNITTTQTTIIETLPPPPIFLCTKPDKCVSLKNILDSFKAPLSEEQAWSLIYQFMLLYRNTAAATAAGALHAFSELEMPDTIENLNLHSDGTVHCAWSEAERKEKEEKTREEKLQRHRQQCDNENEGEEAEHG